MDGILHVTGLENKLSVLQVLDLAGELVAIFHDNDIIFALREQRARRQEEKCSQQ